METKPPETKEIKRGSTVFKQVTEPLDCVRCTYKTGCNSWACCSPACEITKECFGYEGKGSWCPFGEIPKDLKQFYTVI